jgi:ribosomal protein S18 acetylase RimI-like enzyme
MSAIVPISGVTVSVRPATMDDVPFMDGLQSQYTKALGHFKTEWFEGYIAMGGVVVAESDGKRVGYCISRDRYLKRDELGVIYQLCVAPGEQRKLVGAALIQEVFAKSAYGCKLYCLWCAQDLEANHFWESMGFVPIAFRAGSEKKRRVHIFWQRRINDRDTTTPWWYPCQTNAGAIRADRLVFPIPPGTHWREVSATAAPVSMDQPALEAPRAKARVKKPRKKKIEKHKGPLSSVKCSLRFGPAAPPPPAVEAGEKKIERAARPKVKIDPSLFKAARQLRDVWSEHVNSGQLVLESVGKYDVSRALPQAYQAPTPALPRSTGGGRRLPAAA